MGRNKSFGRLRAIAFLFILAFFAGRTTAAEFSADMTDTQGEKIKKSKLYVKGTKYSMFLEESGEQLQIIVDNEQKKTVVVIMSAKEFREIPSDDMMSVMNDPFQGYIYTASMGEEKKTGTETVNGYECDKFTVTMQGTVVVSKWVARKLGFPVKIVAHDDRGWVIELSNITEGPIDDAKFNIPEGFTKWIDPESLPVEIPAWASGIETAPVLVPPFEQAMTAGDIIRIKVAPGKSLKVQSKNASDTETVARVIPFKDGRPLKKEKDYYNLTGTLYSVRHETPAAADEFVVYVYKGSFTATAKWQEMTEMDVAAGGEFRYKIEGWDNISTFMVNISDGESVVTIHYFKEGLPLSEDEIGPVKWRTITLKDPNETDNRTLSTKGDELVYKVEKGKIQVKMGQYDSFEF
ncbi:MAG: hypothetical protein JXA92_05105 [candidate division Zixibacteria bacterium]|nr:hypothetical protein [candidate division Zixibacteria bacterium]